MPRGKDLSWMMKTTIWDLASKSGPRFEAILRDLEHLCRHDMPLEGEAIPDARTVKAVIKELQSLNIEVLSTLPRHIWHLRNDYDDIKDDLERITNIRDEKAKSASQDAKWEPSTIEVPLDRDARTHGPRLDFMQRDKKKKEL